MEYIKYEVFSKQFYLQSLDWFTKRNTKLNLTSKANKIFIILYDLLSLSKKKNWIDYDGKMYVKVSYESLLQLSKYKSKSTISKAIKELENVGLVEKKQTGYKQVQYYILTTSEVMRKIKKNQTEEDFNLIANEYIKVSTNAKKNHKNSKNKKYKKDKKDKNFNSTQLKTDSTVLEKENEYLKNNDSTLSRTDSTQIEYDDIRFETSLDTHNPNKIDDCDDISTQIRTLFTNNTSSNNSYNNNTTTKYKDIYKYIYGDNKAQYENKHEYLYGNKDKYNHEKENNRVDKCLEKYGEKQEEIIESLKNFGLNNLTIRNIMRLKHISLERVNEVLETAVDKNWGEGAIYKALAENWILHKKTKQIEYEMSEEEKKEKMAWLNYFAGFDKNTKAEIFEIIKDISIAKLNSIKKKIGTLSVAEAKRELKKLKLSSKKS